MDEISKMKPRKAYQKIPRVQITTEGTPRTKQSFKNECDINQIMAKYQKTGAISHFNNRSPQYGDATGADFTSAMNLITSAQELFNELPSSLRNRFGNSPSAFLDFVQDPANALEMAELGLTEGGPSVGDEVALDSTTDENSSESTDSAPA